MTKLSALSPLSSPQLSDKLVVVQSAGPTDSITTIQNMLPIIGANLLPLLFNPYKFRVYLNTSIPSYTGGTNIVIPFDTKQWDTGTNVDVVTHKGRFTCPIAGFYHINASINYQNGANNAYQYGIVLYKNGTVQVSAGSGIGGVSQSSQVVCTLSDEIQAAAGDYFEIFAYSSSPTSTIGVNGGLAATYFSGYLVSTT